MTKLISESLWPDPFPGVSTERQTRGRQTRATLGTRFAFVGWIVVLVCSAESPAIAQPDQTIEDVDTPGLVIEATAGWDGTVDQTTPIPVSFLISNYAEQILEGELLLSDPWNGKEAILGEIAVSPGGTTRFSSIQNLSDWFDCHAELRSGGRVLWRRELAISSGQGFVANVNYALFVDSGGRALALPGTLNDTSSIVSTEIVVAGEKGRPFQCLTAKPWQVPNHPGPLVVLQAIVFPESAAESDMNRAQWRAVVEWVCQGGAVFLHAESEAIINRLLDSAPLTAEPAIESGPFAIRRIGLGAMYEYPQALMTADGSKMRQQIAETIPILSKYHLTRLVDSGGLYRRRGGLADKNRTWVVTFFLCYTFLIGGVALALFRLNQWQIGSYTVVVVVGASILAGVLGGILRVSEGDLRWLTVTQAGAGGVVQVGRIEVQSAGGRNKLVAATGEHVDLQNLGTTDRYYAWNRSHSGYSPFTWQPNLAKSLQDTYQVNVPITPWGQRRLHATAYAREFQRMDIAVRFEPGELSTADPRSQSPILNMPTGQFSVQIDNHLPFDLTDCWLVIGVTHRTSDPNLLQQVGRGQLVQMQIAAVPTSQAVGGPQLADGLIDAYHMQEVSLLAAGETYRDSFDGNFQYFRNDWEMNQSWQNGSLTLPRISHMGAIGGWLVGRISESPILDIDEQRSDFVPHESLHMFVQEIIPEDLPDPALFLGAEDKEASEADGATEESKRPTEAQ